MLHNTTDWINWFGLKATTRQYKMKMSTMKTNVGWRMSSGQE